VVHERLVLSSVEPGGRENVEGVMGLIEERENGEGRV